MFKLPLSQFPGYTQLFVTMSERDTLELVLQRGAATRTWGIWGEGFKGTGKRSRAIFWKSGASGKQNLSAISLQKMPKTW